MKDKTFTILTSGRNSSAFIKDWADSILVQNYRPLSVVFVDDASKDKTFAKVESRKEEFEIAGIQLTVLKNRKRLFCSDSYRKAFEESDGFFMGVLDSDDMLVPDAIEYVMGLYNQYQEVGWIYTQFEKSISRKMKNFKKGFCRAPGHKQSLLSLGDRRKHIYSHWRTFSKRVPKLKKIWKKGLKCAIDKFMGYRLEELSIGLFTDRVCYKYREGVKKSISSQGKSKATWKHITLEAKHRRKIYKLKPYKILIHEAT